MFSPNNRLHPFPAPHFKTFQYVRSTSLTVPVSTHHKVMPQIYHFTNLFLKFKSKLQAKIAFFFFFFNPAFATEILDLISRVKIAPSNANG